MKQISKTEEKPFMFLKILYLGEKPFMLYKKILYLGEKPFMLP
jgi:hypothetical protein